MKRLLIVLSLVFTASCIDVATCYVLGACGDPAPEKTKEKPAQSLPSPKPEPNQSIAPAVDQSHACCAAKAFCIDRDDAYCCKVCGAPCL